MLEWERVPWSLWVFAALNSASSILVDIEASGPILAKLLFLCIMSTWLFLLLKGLRWVWIGTLGILVLGFVVDLASDALAWRGIAVGLIGFALLLLP
jgi:hypothetical protein